MRYSKQRELVLQKVEQLCDHPTAEEIFDLAARECPGLSLGTVYRNLNLLEEMGQLRRIHTGIGGDRFDAVITAHPHLICTRCGGVFDLQCDIDRETELLRQTFERAGAQVDEVQIRAWGTCDRCKEEGTL